MTNPNYRHRILILDRSGSIANILSGQQSGLAEFFAMEASVPGKATYSVWQFDNQIECVHSFETLDEVKDYQIVPRNMTSLYDAVGLAVTTEGEMLARMPEDERPDDVTVIISSDGQENSSAEWTAARVAELLEDQQKTYGWRVLYLGTNQDAMYEGDKIGASSGNTVSYAPSNIGAENSWKMSAEYLSRAPMRRSAVARGQSVDFTDEERALGESGEKKQ